MLADEGLHVPVIPFCDVFGKEGTVPPAQMVRPVPNAKVVVTLTLTVTANEAFVAH